MNRRHPIRILLLAALAIFLTAGQGTQAQAPQQTVPKPQSATPPAASPNDFPVDTTNVPVIPANGAAPVAAADNTPPPTLPSVEADPVRSPDDADSSDATTGDSFSSSSSSALAHMPQPEDIPDAAPAKPSKEDRKANRVPGIFNRGKTAQEAKAENSESDLDVGFYYLDRHNWQGALSRFQSALVLDPENPDVYWGLAEAERNLKDYANAKVNYQKLIDYDPQNKHAKEAKKLLKEPEIANAAPQK